AVTWTCLLLANWLMNFLWKSACPVIEFRGRFMYHLRAASLKVPGKSLHFTCSSAPMVEV
ncbi:hypothetical protein A2U01_0108585, partial [Trifolium medium]|nr:hypothetical protein [Trifolium medium]